MGCRRVLKERSLMMSSVKESSVKQPPPSGRNEHPCSNNPKWALSTQQSLKSSLTSLICALGALFNWSKQRFPKTSQSRDICTSGLKLCKQSVLFQFSYMSFSTSNVVRMQLVHCITCLWNRETDLKTRFCLLKSETNSHFLYFFFFLQSTLAA